MRIISGTLQGHNFDSPNSMKTHPMSEKVRGALFNTLGDIQGLSLLDAFAGSGAVSFEAISRGASKVTAIDTDIKAFLCIRQNAKKLQISGDTLKVTHANCFTWSANNENKTFDLVIADPPYQLKRLNHRHVFKMLDNVTVGGLFVLSLPPRNQMADYYASQEMNRLQELVRKDYGDAELVFYRRIA